MSKKIKFYFRKDNGQLLVVRNNHSRLVRFLSEKSSDFIKRYNSLSDGQKRSGDVYQYLVDKKEFIHLQKELGIKRDEVVIFYSSTRQPVFSIARLQLGEKKVINISKKGVVTVKQ